MQYLRPMPPLPLSTSQPHIVLEAPERVQMLLWGLKRLAARRHREMGSADRFPALHSFYPVVRSRAGQVHTAFEPKGAGVAPGFLSVLPDAGNDRFALVMQIKERKPPVSQTRNAAHAGFRWQRHLGRTRANPDGDGLLDRSRIDPGVRDLMPPTTIRHHLLGPQQAQHLNLFLAAAAAGPKILAERLIFHRIPADADTKAQASATQHIHLRSLLCHQSGLTLRQNNNGRG